MQCDQCETEPKKPPKQSALGNECLPRGWQRTDGVWCPKCWRKSYRVRAVTFPILGPAGDWTKDDMYAALRDAWKWSTAAVNIAIREFAKADVTRLPEHEKLPPIKLPQPYQAIREAVPGLASGNVSALIQWASRRYLARRLEVVWFGKASFPAQKYPTPLPVRAQDWRFGLTPDGHPAISFRLAGASRTLLLKTAGCHRQMAAFDRLLDGTAFKSELSIYLRDKYAMAKLCCWVPKTDRAAREKSGMLLVRTGPDALLTATIADAKNGKPWVYHADALRHRNTWHAERLQRLGDDRKTEFRSPRNARKKSARLVGDVARRHADYMQNGLAKCAKLLVSYAARRGVAMMMYDDTDKSYSNSFPWTALKTAISWRCDAENIEFSAKKNGASDDGSVACDETVAEGAQT